MSLLGAYIRNMLPGTKGIAKSQSVSKKSGSNKAWPLLPNQKGFAAYQEQHSSLPPLGLEIFLAFRCFAQVECLTHPSVGACV